MRTAPFATKWEKPARKQFKGKFVTLTPLDPESDAKELYQASHLDEEKLAIWKYLPYGPFENVEAMRAWQRSIAQQNDPLFFCASLSNGRKIGMNSIMSIVPEMGRAELGHIWYSPEVHHTKVNTEAAYLFLRYLFDELDYRRVEWKCDALNSPSRAAALRMGFQFEGIFRQHLIVKEQNRDTAWFSMVDREWPEKKRHFEQWLYHPENTTSLRELNGVSA